MSDDFESLDGRDLGALIKIMDEHIAAEISGNNEDSDDESYIYQEAMQAFYGDDIFDRIETARKKKKLADSIAQQQADLDGVSD